MVQGVVVIFVLAIANRDLVLRRAPPPEAAPPDASAKPSA